MNILKITLITVFLILANITDIREYKIKNKYSLVLLILGLILGIVENSVLDCIFGALLPLILLPLFLVKMLGAGDIKALCAVGAVIGIDKIGYMIIFTFLSGGAIALIFMILNNNFIERFKHLYKFIKSCILLKSLENYDFGGEKKSCFRFSYALTCGFLLTIINSYIVLV